MKKIDNLIFDFGGVLYDIDLQRMIDAFRKLGINEDNFIDDEENIFYLIEKGMIEPVQLVNELAYFSEKKLSSGEIINAFNSVLIGLPKRNLTFLEKACKNYKTYLLSNTNEIHYEKFYNEIVDNINTRNFYNCFEKEYYSFDLGMRKPELEIFEYVINDSNLDPKLTLFVDDDKENIDAAKKTGLNTFWMNEVKSWEDLIKEYDLKID